MKIWRSLKNIFAIIYDLIGNAIQVFIFIIFFDFLNHRFKEWMINFYVATGCNYNNFNQLFVVLAISIFTITTLGIIRYLWFRFRFLKQKQLHDKESVKHANH